MSKDESISAPVSSAGIMTFSNTTSSKVLLDPKLVLALAFAFIVLELIFGLIF